jgi:hypothetical protein
MNQDDIVIEYRFRFAQDPDKRFVVRLRRSDLQLLLNPQTALPAWTRLEHRQCPNCPLRVSEHPYCPAAMGLVELMDNFMEFLSTDPAEIIVVTEAREYRRKATVQQGISSLMGLVMATSGCPVMEKLRPMVHVHLPFATIDETMFRATSMYLLAQFYRLQRGQSPDWELEHLVRIFEEVAQVNQAFARRLVSINPKDASLNALANLDCFALMTSFSIARDNLEAFEPLYRAYLSEPSDPAHGEGSGVQRP